MLYMLLYIGGAKILKKCKFTQNAVGTLVVVYYVPATNYIAFGADPIGIKVAHQPKIRKRWIYHRIMRPNDADGMANNVDPD